MSENVSESNSDQLAMLAKHVMEQILCSSALRVSNAMDLANEHLFRVTVMAIDNAMEVSQATTRAIVRHLDKCETMSDVVKAVAQLRAVTAVEEKTDAG